MNQEQILTTNKFEDIFHPFLLKNFTVKKDKYAILPISTSNKSDKIDQYKNISNSNKKIDETKILNSKQIKNYFTSGEFFLLANFQANSLDDIYQLIDELILSNRKMETIDRVLNIIFKTWGEQIDDISIDKFVNFYQKYFTKFYSVNIEYQKMFKQIQSSLKINDLIHNDIINNILKK